jgi:hypothetical protein
MVLCAHQMRLTRAQFIIGSPTGSGNRNYPVIRLRIAIWGARFVTRRYARTRSDCPFISELLPQKCSVAPMEISLLVTPGRSRGDEGRLAPLVLDPSQIRDSGFFRNESNRREAAGVKLAGKLGH